LDHPNIIKLVKAIETKRRIFLMMELARGGTLKNVIRERRLQKSPIKDEDAALVMKGVFSAMQYLHHKNILYRDLKPGISKEISS